ncbi:putative ZPR1-protein binds to translation elongation factor eEF-1 [Serendipita vermifera]|nr:putative ZPR1-protein binds to translation elongation factor eEF-1 [Serendipita vermifera]
MQANQNFPAIGALAEKADALDEKANASATGSTTDEERPLQEIESLCMACGEQGVTRMMLTSIPYFKEVIVSSFRCEHCGNQNNEIQSAGAIRDFGLVYTVKVLTAADLNRQLVKSSYCTVTVPEFELTIPANRGQLTTIEGLIKGVIDDLSPEQPLRRIQNPAAYEKIHSIIDKLREVVPGEDEETKTKEENPERPVPPFTIKLEDPSGNSFVEFIGSMSDPKWNMREYKRTLEDNKLLGLVSDDAVEGSSGAQEPDAIDKDEIFSFAGKCSSCSRPLDTKMKRVDIPYFKEIIIMSTNCEACGYRDNEVKSSGAVSAQGKRITLKVQDSDDLSRDILKSETCGLAIPEIDLVLTAGTLGGRFTTIEGILNQVYDELSGKLFSSGDSTAPQDRAKFAKFLGSLKDIQSGSHQFTLILDDPLSNSYLQNLYAPDPDPNMTTEMYDRTKEQNDDLGLSDMKLDNYEDDEIGDGHSLQAVKEEPEAELDANPVQ